MKLLMDAYNKGTHKFGMTRHISYIFKKRRFVHYSLNPVNRENDIKIQQDEHRFQV